MRDLTRRLSLAVLVSMSLSTAVAAQGRAAPGQSAGPLLGFHAGLATNHLDALVGAQFSYQIAPQFDLYPSFDIYFPSGPLNAWGLNANVRYWPRLNTPNPGLYVGGGLGFTHFSALGFDDSRVGLNLLGGWQFHTPNLQPFVELRAVLASDVDRIEFVGGLNFRL